MEQEHGVPHVNCNALAMAKDHVIDFRDVVHVTQVIMALNANTHVQAVFMALVVNEHVNVKTLNRATAPQALVTAAQAGQETIARMVKSQQGFCHLLLLNILLQHVHQENSE